MILLTNWCWLPMRRLALGGPRLNQAIGANCGGPGQFDILACNAADKIFGPGAGEQGPVGDVGPGRMLEPTISYEVADAF